VISIFAPDGIGEVGPGTDLPAAIATAVAADACGPLRSGDIVVVTSKIISKAEGRFMPAARRDEAIDAESLGTVARRGPTRIVRTRHGLTLAAAGVDNSNVASDSILLLPLDPDASAARLRSALEAATGARLGVVVSDTAGRAWRIGQTDQAIGASGVQVIERYEGQQDAYGNELQVTAVAIADELAAATDLAKAKLAGRPVAVIRGLERYVCSDTAPAGGRQPETSAALLVRDAASDMFRHGSREAVVAAVLEATGQRDQYETVLGHPTPESMLAAVLAGSGRTGGEAELLRRILVAAVG